MPGVVNLPLYQEMLYRFEQQPLLQQEQEQGHLQPHFSQMPEGHMSASCFVCAVTALKPGCYRFFLCKKPSFFTGPL